MTEYPMKAAIFDVDGTLLPGPSSERRFMSQLMRGGILHPRQVVSQVFFAARYWPSYGRHVFKKDKAYLVDLPVDDVNALAERFVAEKLLPIIHPEVRAKLERHLANAEHVALVSGTPEFIAQPLAAHLGVSHVYATRCVTRAGRFVMAPPVSHPFGYEKLAIAQRICLENGHTLGQVSAYADSGHDITLLGAVGRPVAVFPDRALRAQAVERGWEIVEVGVEIPTVS